MGTTKQKTLGVDIKGLPISVILSKAKDPGDAGRIERPQGILPVPPRMNIAMKDREYFVSSRSGTLYIGREKQLKGWLRSKKIALIESKNPRWQDFAEKWGAQILFAGESMKNR